MNAAKALKPMSSGVTDSQKKLLKALPPEQRKVQQLQMEEQNKAIVADAISAIIKIQGEVMTKMADRIA